MKICVVVPSTAYLNQAGARIRYARLQPVLAALGHEIGFHTTEEVDPADRRFDLYLFSKCYDAGAVLLAMAARRHQAVVGVDLFDDMFSHDADVRTIHYRRWAADIAPYVDFALCSTERMAEIAENVFERRPVHVMHDPWDDFDIAALNEKVDRKYRRALATREIDVAWFGVGDNPFFPVGLSDLFAFGGELQRLESSGFKVMLRILTNERALTERGLRMIEQLPVSHHVDVWSIEGERALLDNSILTFLPVNGQKFSVAKSLNRCMSALAAGTQVLSAGHPLYAPLDRFLYRDPAAFLDDLDRGALRVRAETTAALHGEFERFGNPTVEAEQLIAFLSPIRPGDMAPPTLPALVSGRRSSPTARRVAARLRVVTIASTLAPLRTEDDVVMSGAADPPHVRLDLTPRATNVIAPPLRQLLLPQVDGRSTLEVPISVADALLLFGTPDSDLCAIAATYGPAMRCVAALLRGAFPGICLLLDEHEAPFSASFDDGGAGRPATSALFSAVA